MRYPNQVALCLAILAFSTCHVTAQTSSGFSPQQQYGAIKDTLKQFLNRGLVPSNIKKPDRVPTPFNRPGEYDLFYCGDAVDYLGWFEDHRSGDQSLHALTNLALQMVVWESDIRKLGVPDQVWQPVLEKYEASGIEHAREPTEEERSKAIDELANELNARNGRTGRTRPKFVSKGGCGSGGIEVRFALTPADGQLFLIPVFLYKLCQAQKLNPEDLRSCDRWKEVFSGGVAYASGDYVYLARWSDGVVRCGSLDVKKFTQNRDSTIEITKLRSPECRPGW